MSLDIAEIKRLVAKYDVKVILPTQARSRHNVPEHPPKDPDIIILDSFYRMSSEDKPG